MNELRKFKDKQNSTYDYKKNSSIILKNLKKLKKSMMF